MEEMVVLQKGSILLIKDADNVAYVMPIKAYEALHNEYFMKTLSKFADKFDIRAERVNQYLTGISNVWNLLTYEDYLELQNNDCSLMFILDKYLNLDDLNKSELQDIGLTRCADCDEIISLDDATDTNNGYVCESCLSNYYECEDTDNYVYEDDVYLALDSDDDEHYFEYNDDLIWSNTQDCYIREGDDRLVYTDSNNYYTDYVTERYRDNNCYYCDANDSWYTDYDDCCANKDDCDRAPDEWFSSYSEHCTHFLELDSNGDLATISSRYIEDRIKRDNQAYLGFELEVEPDDESNEYNTLSELRDNVLESNTYMFKRDGSLTDLGVEIVSNPMTFEAFESRASMWNEMLETLRENDYTSHDNGDCGLHFHLSRRLFGATEEEQTDNIKKMIKFYNDNYNDIIKFSRRTQSQCERWCARYCDIGTSEEFQRTFERYDKAGHDSRRYMAVNITNEHTIEIRIMRGTLNEDTFWASYDFIKTIAFNSLKMNWDDVNANNLTKWLEGMENNTIEYAKTRNAFNSVFLN